MGKYLRAESTARDTFVTSTPCASVDLSATSMQTGETVDLGGLTNVSGDKLTWLNDPQSSEVPESFLWQTVRLKYRQTTVGGQVLTSYVYADVLEETPPTPEWLTTIYECQQRLRAKGHGQEIAGMITKAHALCEQGVGGAIFATTETANVEVGRRVRELHLNNIPIDPTSVILVQDHYNAEWQPGAFVVDAAAGVLKRYFVSPGQNYAASMFGAQNEAALAGVSTDQTAMEPLLEGTWRVTYTGGLELDPRWERLIRPDLAMAVLLTVEDGYNIRTSRATAEQEGDQNHTLDIEMALPPRAASICRHWSLLGA